MWGNVAEYSSAEEMLQAYRETRRRLETAKPRPRPRLVEIVPVNDPEPASKAIEYTGLAWSSPTMSEMPAVHRIPENCWLRFLDGVALIAIQCVDHHCPSASVSMEMLVLDPVDNGVHRALRLPNGARLRSNKDVLRAVAHKHQMSVVEMMADRRTREIVRARQEAMWWFKKITTHSLPRIGRIMGGRDHTTILHGIRAHQSRIDAGEF